MNKIFTIIFVAVLVIWVNPANGQIPNGKSMPPMDRGSIQAKKNAFITAELGLTPEEAAEFIPLSQELEARKFEMNQRCKKLSRELKHKRNISNDDYDKVIKLCLDINIQEAQLEKEYYDKFREILSPEKLYKYRSAELKFARSIFAPDRKNSKRND